MRGTYRTEVGVLDELYSAKPAQRMPARQGWTWFPLSSLCRMVGLYGNAAGRDYLSLKGLSYGIDFENVDEN